MSEQREAEVERVSAAVHEAWMASKRASGVTSRKSESGEELMVPYAQLSEAAKDLDRVTVRTVLLAAGAAPPTEEPQRDASNLVWNTLSGWLSSGRMTPGDDLMTWNEQRLVRRIRDRLDEILQHYLYRESNK